MKAVLWVLLGIALLAGCFLYSAWRTSRAAGIYLTDGGLNYVVLRRAGIKLYIAEPGIYGRGVLAETAEGPEIQASVSRGPSLLHLEYGDKKMWEELGAQDPGPDYFEYKRSKKPEGDWDLVRFSGPSTAVPISLSGGSGGSSSGRAGARPPFLDAPIPSALHRIDDERVPAYFKAQYRERDPEAAFQIATELFNAHPNDLHVRALFLNAAMKKGDFEALDRESKAFRQVYAGSTNPWQQRIPQLIDLALRANELTRAGKNAAPLLEQTVGHGQGIGDWETPRAVDLQTLRRRFPLLLDYESFATVPWDLNTSFPGVHNYLPHQVTTKTLNVLALFQLIEGRREKARDLMTACYAYGRGLGDNGPLIQRLIGTAIQSISLADMEIFALNACETPEEAKAFLDFINRWNCDTTYDAVLKNFSDAISLHSRPLQDLAQNQNYTDPAVRATVAATRYQVLRAALAAHHHHLGTGAFPATEADFSLLPNLPQDPFLAGTPLSFAPGADEFTVYSVGPDRLPNGGEIKYDPTNGTTSAGDIYLRIPRERQYPFSREGLKAASPEDITRQFLDDLPADIFAKTRGLPLSVTTDESGAVVIYSFGPDSDEGVPNAPALIPAASGNPFTPPPSPQSAGVISPHFLEPMYDPTNGVTSNGDLFITLPRPD